MCIFFAFLPFLLASTVSATSDKVGASKRFLFSHAVIICMTIIAYCNSWLLDCLIMNGIASPLQCDALRDSINVKRGDELGVITEETAMKLAELEKYIQKTNRGQGLG